MTSDVVGSISVVIPVMDEEATLSQLCAELTKAIADCGIEDYELIMIDDGSKDSSWSVMQELSAGSDGNIKALKLRRNFGKAIALDCGFKHASGDVVVTIDADLQDDPAELPKFLAKLDEGYDVVSGWKQNRQDPLSKNLPSKLFNGVTAKITGIPLHDFNCGYKVYRKKVLKNLRLYGELHRYVPVLAHDEGFRVTEVPVHHRAREHGVSKYGWERYTRGLVDLITVLATTRYLQKPGHLFGGIGLAFGALGTLILTYLGLLWVFGQGPIGDRPLFSLGILLEILSIQLISLGVLAELVTRHSQKRDLDSIVSESTVGHRD